MKYVVIGMMMACDDDLNLKKKFKKNSNRCALSTTHNCLSKSFYDLRDPMKNGSIK